MKERAAIAIFCCLLSGVMSGCTRLSSPRARPLMKMTHVYSERSGIHLTRFWYGGDVSAAYMVGDSGTRPSFIVLSNGKDGNITAGIEDSDGDGRFDTISFSSGSWLVDMFVSSDGITWSRAPESRIRAIRKKANEVADRWGDLFRAVETGRLQDIPDASSPSAVEEEEGQRGGTPPSRRREPAR